MQEKIEEILKKIFTDINDSKSDSISLMIGRGGDLIFKYLYLNHFNIDGVNSDFQKLIQLVADKSQNYYAQSFCNGKSGINWAFAFLHKNNIIDKEDFNIISNDDENISKIAISMLENDNYDFLYGAVGIGYSLLYLKGEEFSSFYLTFFELLKKLMEKSLDKKSIPYYDFGTNLIINNKVNLGLAHGIPSILKFSLQCYTQNINKNEAKEMAIIISEYLISHINKNTTSNYFSYIIEIDSKEHNSKSRLGWCYGDLGIGYILYQAGVILKREDITNLSIEILRHTTNRRNFLEASIFDAGICHGSSGVAHIYHRMWQYTKDDCFKEACDFWIAKTVDFYLTKDGLEGFKKFNPANNSYEYSNSLLEGTCGIGLVLLSYLTKDFSWDYCLMLNN